MKLNIFAIKDRAVSAFMQPFYAPTIGGAVRAFQDALNDGTTPMNKHPDDYDLWHLGEWDDNTGQFTQADPIQQVAMGKQLKTQ